MGNRAEPRGKAGGMGVAVSPPTRVAARPYRRTAPETPSFLPRPGHGPARHPRRRDHDPCPTACLPPVESTATEATSDGAGRGEAILCENLNQPPPVGGWAGPGWRGRSRAREVHSAAAGRRSSWPSTRLQCGPLRTTFPLSASFPRSARAGPRAPCFSSRAIENSFASAGFV